MLSSPYGMYKCGVTRWLLCSRERVSRPVHGDQLVHSPPWYNCRWYQCSVRGRIYGVTPRASITPVSNGHWAWHESSPPACGTVDHPRQRSLRHCWSDPTAKRAALHRQSSRTSMRCEWNRLLRSARHSRLIERTAWCARGSRPGDDIAVRRPGLSSPADLGPAALHQSSHQAPLTWRSSGRRACQAVWGGIPTVWWRRGLHISQSTEPALAAPPSLEPCIFERCYLQSRTALCENRKSGLFAVSCGSHTSCSQRLPVSPNPGHASLVSPSPSDTCVSRDVCLDGTSTSAGRPSRCYLMAVAVTVTVAVVVVVVVAAGPGLWLWIWRRDWHFLLVSGVFQAVFTCRSVCRRQTCKRVKFFLNRLNMA